MARAVIDLTGEPDLGEMLATLSRQQAHDTTTVMITVHEVDEVVARLAGRKPLTRRFALRQTPQEAAFAYWASNLKTANVEWWNSDKLLEVLQPVSHQPLAPFEHHVFFHAPPLGLDGSTGDHPIRLAIRIAPDAWSKKAVRPSPARS
jgi:hypothetical protein